MKMIDGWADHLWKAWSIRLAGVAAVAGAYFVAFPSELQRLVAMVPEQYREGASVLAGLLIFATASGSKLVAQKNLRRDGADELSSNP